MQHTTPRRTFIKTVALGVGAFALLPTAASAADLPPVAESDAMAAALGYKEDSSKVDAAKYPKHTASQLCENCKLIGAKQGDGRVGCSIFPGKSVNPKGWCAAYVVKA